MCKRENESEGESINGRYVGSAYICLTYVKGIDRVCVFCRH